MHDPMVVAFEIKSPFKSKKGDRKTIITIWHNDPEKDGTDDSCGWFIRLRHTNKELYEQIVKDFEFNFKNNYWFSADGVPLFSTSAIVLEMYSTALWKVVNHSRRKRDRFMRKYLYQILHFAENPTDSLSGDITNEYRYRLIQHDRSQVDSQEERIRSLASVVYCDILRKMQKWYQHPRWHIHHWEIQFIPFQRLKRRYWDKCSICGKRGFKGNAMSDWDGTKVWHEECENSAIVKPAM